jgi:ketosteroid isomerase-like protein
VSEQALKEIETFVYDVYTAMSRLDIATTAKMLSADLQAADGVTRGWTRGMDEIAEHLANLENSLETEKSRVLDLTVRNWGDTAAATFVVDQEYTISGVRHQVLAPTTMVMRREDGEWKLVLFHSVPLPTQE